MTRLRRTGLALAIGIGLLFTAAVPARADTTPTVTGPVTGGTHGYPFGSLIERPSPVDVAAAGYAEGEYFLSGTARSFTADGAVGSDGRWSVHAAGSAPYTTRMLVERPANPRRFNGTVVVEWLNVSASAEIPPDLYYAHRELLRDGFAWVGVSAQQLGVTGSPYSLKTWDPARYGPLSHPGDSFSYDIFRQAGRALRHPHGARPLGDLRVRRLIADGESQSATRMATYVNAVAPGDPTYDGFLVHSRGAGSAPISQAPQEQVNTPATVFLRTDLDRPVLQFQTETEFTTLGYLPARQPDTARLRTWEAAGTAHVDRSALDLILAAQRRDLPDYPAPVCATPINDGQERYLMGQAIRGLNRWAGGGPAPASAPRIGVTAGAIDRDAYGNAEGGVRTPAVDVPLATLTGNPNTPPGWCSLFGTTTPLPPDTIAGLYPTRQEYLSKVARAAAAGARHGYIDARDIPQILKESETAWPG